MYILRDIALNPALLLHVEMDALRLSTFIRKVSYFMCLSSTHNEDALGAFNLDKSSNSRVKTHLHNIVSTGIRNSVQFSRVITVQSVWDLLQCGGRACLQQINEVVASAHSKL